jgi:hypothetical protein
LNKHIYGDESADLAGACGRTLEDYKATFVTVVEVADIEPC